MDLARNFSALYTGVMMAYRHLSGSMLWAPLSPRARVYSFMGISILTVNSSGPMTATILHWQRYHGAILKLARREPGGRDCSGETITSQTTGPSGFEDFSYLFADFSHGPQLWRHEFRRPSTRPLHRQREAARTRAGE